VGQALPHVPQLELSVVDTHCPLQIRLLSHTQPPFEQRSPGLHALLQAPQCAVLLVRSAH
jgi:hypothetical protein